MTLGNKLSKLRKENNYTQEQLADLLGVSRQAISKWESDITYPETDKLIRISKLFHCTTDYLLLEEEAPSAGEAESASACNVSSGGQIFIESPVLKNLVSCFKVFASPVVSPAKGEPNYLLLGVDRGTVFGEHVTPLGWYRTEEEVQREISEIAAAIRAGERSYRIKYHTPIEEKLSPALLKKTAQGESAGFPLQRAIRERKSEKHLWGMPLWHIGRNARGVVAVGCNARGVIAIGMKARGLFSIGLFSIGLFSFGMLSLGLLSAGMLALGLLSAGCFSIGVLAMGAISLGVVSLGAIAIGDFSVGALALGKYLAIGDEARGAIAIGDTKAIGSAFQKVGELTAQETSAVKALLDTTVPSALSWAKEWIQSFL